MNGRDAVHYKELKPDFLRSYKIINVQYPIFNDQVKKLVLKLGHWTLRIGHWTFSVGVLTLNGRDNLHNGAGITVGVGNDLRVVP